MTYSTIYADSQIRGLLNDGIGRPITRSIMMLQPGLDEAEAFKHANIIYILAHKYKIDWRIITAVAFQESSFLFMVGDKECGVIRETGKYTCVYKAVGPMHVYIEHHKDKYNIDTERMVKDLEYAYEVGVRILAAHYKSVATIDVLWFGKYNSTTPKFKHIYADRIMNHYGRIERYLDSLRYPE